MALCQLTVFFPEPDELVRPARQGETYVIPFFPQTGSQSLPEHTQSELQAANTEWSSYEMLIILVETQREGSMGTMQVISTNTVNAMISHWLVIYLGKKIIIHLFILSSFMTMRSCSAKFQMINLLFHCYNYKKAYFHQVAACLTYMTSSHRLPWHSHSSLQRRTETGSNQSWKCQRQTWLLPWCSASTSSWTDHQKTPLVLQLGYLSHLRWKQKYELWRWNLRVNVPLAL